MKKKILILGSTGLLGNAVADYFLNNEHYEVITTYRNVIGRRDSNTIFFDAIQMDFEKLPADADYAINCIGVIKPYVQNNEENTIMINALFPWKLAEWCRENNIKLIHITTDCVFSGKKGKYVESDLHDALDVYGKSKSMGECISKAMVLRTSIIGEEIHNNASLLAWAKSQKNKTVNGYKTHLWNGVTTKEYAAVCDKIMSNELYEEGLFHVYAANDVSKYHMLEMFNKKYGLNLNILEAYPEKCDRTLRTKKELNSLLKIPTVEAMIEEM